MLVLISLSVTEVGSGNVWVHESQDGRVQQILCSGICNLLHFQWPPEDENTFIYVLCNCSHFLN